MGLIVQKFGGTSVGDTSRIKHVADRVIKKWQAGNQVVVVVSAMGKTTDELLELANEITASPPEREIAMLLSTGEQVTISLLAMAIDNKNVPVISFTGSQAGMETENNYCQAKILNIKSQRVEAALEENKIVIVAGFQGIDARGDITTLGRGGSDTTAVALAASLKADSCEVYTDVEGVYTLDPRVIHSARKLESISYDEMLELANLGAKVLHPRAVEYAKEHAVELHVRSSFNEKSGTIVKEVGETMETGGVVTGIAIHRNQVKMAVLGVPDKPGIAFKIFDTIAAIGVNVDLIVQSIHKNSVNDILFTIGKDDLAKTMEALKKVGSEIGAREVYRQDGVAKISVVGAGMAHYPGVAARMFEALAKNSINIEIIATSEIKISCIVSEEQLEKGARALHEMFHLDKKQ